MTELRNPRLQRLITLQATVILSALCSPGFAQTCLAPARPFLPNDSTYTREYADILRRDFYLYIADIEAYFRCLDEERARAFDEARQVSQDYARFLQMVGD
jgi:hypothetical protein